jgi:hypothetical protein
MYLLSTSDSLHLGAKVLCLVPQYHGGAENRGPEGSGKVQRVSRLQEALLDLLESERKLHHLPAVPRYLLLVRKSMP